VREIHLYLSLKEANMEVIEVTDDYIKCKESGTTFYIVPDDAIYIVADHLKVIVVDKQTFEALKEATC
jgi:hypothetical protein